MIFQVKPFSNTKTRRKSVEGGSILLETVIALPIFMVLIGGIMWSGQLIYDKQKLLVADRYVAWNYGNRFAKSYNDVQSKFFDQSTPDSVDSPDTKEAGSSDWWHEVRGSISVTAKMPVWTRGWFYADSLENGDSVPVSAALHGRDLADGSAGGHTVVMQKEKQPTDTRDKQVNHDDRTMGIKYGSIYSENWPAK